MPWIIQGLPCEPVNLNILLQFDQSALKFMLVLSTMAWNSCTSYMHLPHITSPYVLVSKQVVPLQQDHSRSSCPQTYTQGVHSAVAVHFSRPDLANTCSSSHSLAFARWQPEALEQQPADHKYSTPRLKTELGRASHQSHV